MHSHLMDNFRHSHVFLGEAHDRNERKTWAVIAVCTAMMATEIVGGVWFGSVALIADGLHMSTHAGALLIAALAYTYSRRYADDERLAFGTGKLGDLAAFTSAILLAVIALFIGYESLERLVNPVPIAFDQAIPIAVAGLLINLLSALPASAVSSATSCAYQQPAVRLRASLNLHLQARSRSSFPWYFFNDFNAASPRAAPAKPNPRPSLSRIVPAVQKSGLELFQSRNFGTAS
jgi:Co/Zn/Cd efflux system component